MADPRRELEKARRKRHDLKFGATHAGGAITRYLQPNNHRAASQAAAATVQTRVPVHRGGKINAKAIHAITSVAPGAGQSNTCTLRVNGAPSALTCQIGGAGVVEASFAADVELIDTDVIDIDCTTTAGAAGATVDVTIEAEETG